MAGDKQAVKPGQPQLDGERTEFTERDLGTLPTMMGAAARTAVMFDDSRAATLAAEERVRQAEIDREAAVEALTHARAANDMAHSAVAEEFAHLLPHANETSEGRKVLADYWLRMQNGRPPVSSVEVLHSHESREDYDVFVALQDPAVSLVIDTGFEFRQSAVRTGDVLETPGDLRLHSDRSHEVVELAVLIPVNDGDTVKLPLDKISKRLIVGRDNIGSYFLDEFEPIEPEGEKMRLSATWATAAIQDNTRYKKAIEKLEIGEGLEKVLGEMHEANMRTASRALGLDGDKKRAMRVDLRFGQNRDEFVNALIDAEIFDEVLLESARMVEKNESREADLVDFVARAVSDDRAAKPTIEVLGKTKIRLKELLDDHERAVVQ